MANPSITTNFVPVEESNITTDFKPVEKPQGKEPGFVESVKALPRTALELGKGAVSFPFMAAPWAVGMQEKYSGKPYEGLLTKKIPGIDISASELSQYAGEAIQSIGGGPKTEAEKRQFKFVNLPFEAISKVGEFAGETVKQLGGSPSAATLAEASINLAPLFFGRGAGKELLKKAPGAVSKVGDIATERMYKSAVKPGVKYTLEEQKAMTKVGLETGVTVGKETGWTSLETLDKKINEITNRISEVVDTAQGKGINVKTKQIISEIDKAAELYPPWEKASELDKMKEYLSTREEIPIKEARDLKGKIQRSQRSNYDKLSGLANEGEKAAGHAILDQMIKAYPELENLGLQDKALINLREAIQHRTKVWSHRDLISIRMLMEVGSGAFFGTHYGGTLGGAIVGLGLTAMEHPTVKSALAIALDRANKIGKRTGEKMVEKAIPIPPRIAGKAISTPITQQTAIEE